MSALLAASACGLAACAAPTPVAAETEVEIARRVQGIDTIEFRAVGPEGGPLDEGQAVEGELSLADAVHRAVSTSPEIQSALARVRLAMAEADQARLLPNPVLGVVLRVGGGSSQLEASFSQEFVQALQRPARAEIADDRLRATSADAVTTALDVVLDVQESYLDAQSAAALLPLLSERLALVGRLVATAQARLDLGEGTRSDVVTLDAQRVELEVSIDRVRLEERAGRLRLARSIGEPSSAADWSLESWSRPPLPQADQRAWIQAALASRPEVQAAIWRLAALDDEEAVLGLMPWEGASIGVDAQDDDGWQVGPALSTPLPVFDDGSARRDANWAQRIEARHELTRVRRQVVEEVRTAHESLTARIGNLERTERELIPLLRQRRELAEDAYRSGVTDVTPLFLAEQELRIAQTEAIEVEARASLALVRLQRAVGGSGISDSVASTTAGVQDSDQGLRQ